MISFIQNFLGKHHKWLFSVLLAVVIVAFVLTIGNTGGLDFGQSGFVAREFYGVDLSSQREQRRVGDDFFIAAELEGRRVDQARYEEEILSRIVLLHLADVYQVPEPTEAELRTFISNQALFRGEDGRFSADRYSRFLDSLRNNPTVNESRVTEVLLQNYRIGVVREALRGPGYVLPSEAREALAEERTAWTVEVAFLPLANFEPQIDESDEALRAFFAENPARYRIPAQLSLAYVEFPYERYLASVGEPTAAELEAFYAVNRDQFNDATGNVQELDQIRDQVAAALKEQRARRAALEAADEFCYTLFEKGVAKGSDAFASLLEKNGLAVVEIEPFSRGSEPFGLPIPRRQLTESAYQLSSERFYSEPLPSTAGAAVLILDEVIPEQDQDFEAVRDRVLSDYRAQQRMEQFAAAGNALRERIVESLKDGGSFAELAAEGGAEVSRYENFTLSSPPPGMDQFVLFTMQNLQDGEVSPVLTLGSGGFMTYIAEKVVPDVSADDEEVVQTTTFLAAITSQISTRLVLSELIDQGLRDWNTAGAGE